MWASHFEMCLFIGIAVCVTLAAAKHLLVQCIFHTFSPSRRAKVFSSVCEITDYPPIKQFICMASGVNRNWPPMAITFAANLLTNCNFTATAHYPVDSHISAQANGFFYFCVFLLVNHLSSALCTRTLFRLFAYKCEEDCNPKSLPFWFISFCGYRIKRWNTLSPEEKWMYLLCRIVIFDGSFSLSLQFQLLKKKRI